MSDLPNGGQVGDYNLLRPLGEGAAGRVFLATPKISKPFAEPGQPLAVKVYKAEILEHPNQEDRIRREFENGAALNHPNVVKVHDFQIERGRSPFLVMEWVDGVTLADWLGMFDPVSGRLRLHLTTRLLEVLSYLHAQGIWHRDIKPSNIMILPTFEPKLMDLGVAKAVGADSLTPEGERLGTRRNSSPELLQEEEYDQRTDLYSLGTVIYALLHGEEIFADEDRAGPLEDLIRHQNPVIDEERFAQDVFSSQLVAVAKRLLAKAPDDRQNSADEVLGDLAEVTVAADQAGTFEPLHGYIGTALTNLTDDERDSIHFPSYAIARVAMEREIYVYQPRKASDPILHRDLSPEVVYLMDRKRVRESDVFFVLANKPSFGVGQELEIAAAYGKPTFLLSREGVQISRMVRGGFANLLDEVVYASPDDLDQKLRKSLGRSLETLRESKHQLSALATGASEVGPRLQRARMNAGYASVEEFADHLGLTPRLVAALERGEYETIALPFLASIAGALQLPLSQLLADEFLLSAPSEDANLRRLDDVVKGGVDCSARDYLELRDRYLKQAAARGEFQEIPRNEWLSRLSSLQQERFQEAEQQRLV